MDEPVGLTDLALDCARAGDVEQVLKVAVSSLPHLCGAAVQHVPPGAEADPWGSPAPARVESHALPGLVGELLLAWREEPPTRDPGVAAALAIVDTAVGRRVAEAEHSDLGINHFILCRSRMNTITVEPHFCHRRIKALIL